MNALWQVILTILWRLHPVQALEVHVHDIIQGFFPLFTDADRLDRLGNSHRLRAINAAALFDAHRKLDLLIYRRACELAGVTTRLGFQPNYTWTHSSTNLWALWRSFERLVAKYDDYQRYAAKRAERLRRERDNAPLRLAATLQSTSPMLRMMQAKHRRALAVQIATPGASYMDGHARRRAAKAAGGGAFARGPPFGARLPIADGRLPWKRQLPGSPQLDQNPSHWPAQPMRLILLAAIASLAACSEKPPEPATIPHASGAPAIIAAERAFAADAAKTGWVEAFGQWSTPDALVLGQGLEPAGQFLANIDPANRKDTSLAWAPEFAGASAAGDFGFTTGPFNGDGAAFGYYFTVWQQQPNGEWRWIYDGGTDTKTPTTIDPAFNVVLADLPTNSEGAADIAKTNVAVLEAGLAVSTASDAPVSLSAQFAANSRLHRQDAAPVIGDEAITKALEAGPQTINFKQLRSFASAAGDMVFTLGEARWQDDDDQPASGIYGRIWSYTQDGWRIVFDQIALRDLPAATPQ